eukprot:6907722-Heterocapsa_arctica.AAC.1
MNEYALSTTVSGILTLGCLAVSAYSMAMLKIVLHEPILSLSLLDVGRNNFLPLPYPHRGGCPAVVALLQGYRPLSQDHVLYLFDQRGFDCKVSDT